MSNESIFEEIKDWVIAITIAVVLAFFIRYFIVELYKVSGPSMQPTLMGDERLVVNKFIYRFKEPAKGEVLIFQSPADPQKDYIKRVIGLPGDHISIEDGRVYVNGVYLNEPYIAEPPLSDYATRVPDDSLFVMGDNRNNSSDSRFWGPMPLTNLKGQAVFNYLPMNRISPIRSFPHPMQPARPADQQG